MIIIAHRGAAGYAPENSFAALSLAHTLASDWIEFDVRITSDDVLVVSHDDETQRVCGQAGEISALSYQALQQYDIGASYNSKFTGERYPSLKAYLDQILAFGMQANIELKNNDDNEIHTAQQAIQLLQAYTPEQRKQFLVSSFSNMMLEMVYQALPDLRIGVLFRTPDTDWLVKCQQLNAYSVNIRDDLVTPQWVAQAHQASMKVFVYLVNEPQRALELQALNIDGIFTSYPDKLNECLKKTNLVR